MAGRERSPGAETRSIIRGKLRVPPAPPRPILRHRLDELLGGLLRARSPTTVYATAGAGKTTAVAAAVATLGVPVAWLTLDDTDRAPGRLLTYLEAALSETVATAQGAATEALRLGLDHPEAAGILAEAVEGVDTVLVIDEVERLVDAPRAVAVIGALVRYAPATLRVVLVGRRPIDLDIGGRDAFQRALGVDDRDLALTVHEAREALELTGSADLDAEAVVESTGGWVAGVLFEAWRSVDHAPGRGGEADPLNGYLASQVLGLLDPECRDFLVRTSVISEVTASRAAALGQAEASSIMERLRARLLPVTWDSEREALRCHPRFRQYLATLLGRRPADEVRSIHRALGHLYVAESLPAEAVEAFLASDEPEEALAPAQTSVEEAVDRLDLDVADRWVRQLRPLTTPGDDGLTRAELMLAIAREQYGRAAATADLLHEAGLRDALAAASPRAAWMIAWCYFHTGNVAALLEIAACAHADATAIVQVLLHYTTAGGDVPAPPITLTGGPLDALVMRSEFLRGNLSAIVDPPASKWATALTTPWRVAALLAQGRTAEAADLFDQHDDGSSGQIQLHAIVEPELRLALDEPDQALETLARGRHLVAESGSAAFQLLSLLVEARIRTATGDLAGAEDALTRLEEHPSRATFSFIAERIDHLAGTLRLLRGDAAGAAARLRAAVQSMVGSDRLLELPVAGVRLAEAELRCGDIRAAEQAATRALAATGRLGSSFTLIAALSRCPAVRAHMCSLTDERGQAWRALADGEATQDPEARAVARLLDLGGTRLEVAGRPVRPRIRKSLELLAYLERHGGRPVPRTELLDALFGGRADDSTRSYLRQAVYRLREALPSAAPRFEGDRLHLDPTLALESESGRARELLRAAESTDGDERKSLLTEALTLLDRGDYLEGCDGRWIDDERDELARLSAAARLELARIALAEDDPEDARRLALEALEPDPYREQAWQVLMRAAALAEDIDGVTSAYRLCGRVMRRLGIEPSAQTRALFAELRGHDVVAR